MYCKHISLTIIKTFYKTKSYKHLYIEAVTESQPIPGFPKIGVSNQLPDSKNSKNRITGSWYFGYPSFLEPGSTKNWIPDPNFFGSWQPWFIEKGTSIFAKKLLGVISLAKLTFLQRGEEKPMTKSHVKEPLLALWNIFYDCSKV